MLQLRALLFLIFYVQFLSAQEINFIYKQGEEGYQCFRIPTLIATQKGSLLAFAEARKKDCGDAGDIDLVVKRSSDGGKTWSKLMLVWDDGNNTCGNPSPVVDARTGKILLLSTWNLGVDREPQIIDQTSKDSRRVFVMHSADDGLHWTAPREITADVKLPNWTWYATGPCNGIQLTDKKHRGRLVIPCDHIEAGSKKYYSHVIYSDDGGVQWKLGGSTPEDQVNECTVVELPCGALFLNMRNYNDKRYRQTSLSNDGGLTWSSLKQDTALIEPVCQANMIRVDQKKKKSYLIFSNPASQRSRSNMTVRISDDNGRTWKYKKVIYEGPSAYSNLVALPDGKIGCLFECGNKNPYEGIAFKVILINDMK